MIRGFDYLTYASGQLILEAPFILQAHLALGGVNVSINRFRINGEPYDRNGEVFLGEESIIGSLESVA